MRSRSRSCMRCNCNLCIAVTHTVQHGSNPPTQSNPEQPRATQTNPDQPRPTQTTPILSRQCSLREIKIISLVLDSLTLIQQSTDPATHRLTNPDLSGATPKAAEETRTRDHELFRKWLVSVWLICCSDRIGTCQLDQPTNPTTQQPSNPPTQQPSDPEPAQLQKLLKKPGGEDPRVCRNCC